MKIGSKFLDVVEALFEPEEVSKPIVMASAAGWYVGEVYLDGAFGFVGPHSRLTGYYRSEEEATKVYLQVFANDEGK